MAFVPIKEDVPTYFIPMLNDTDRNLAYENAIKETIASFITQEKRAPRVLDVGAGSGLLTLIALENGAQHVTALEANSDLATLLVKILEANIHYDCKEPFDIVMCELLGSMIHSESMAVYLYDLIHKRKLVRAFGGNRRYVIPNSARMTIRAYRCPEACAILTGIPYAPMDILYKAVYDHTQKAQRLEWVQDESMKLCIAATDCVSLTAPVVVLQEDYSTNIIQHPISVSLTFDPDPAAILVLEWHAQLSASVRLRHDLEHVKKLKMPTMVGRWIAWGHLFARPLPSIRVHTFLLDYEAADLHFRFSPTSFLSHTSMSTSSSSAPTSSSCSSYSSSPSSLSLTDATPIKRISIAQFDKILLKTR